MMEISRSGGVTERDNDEIELTLDLSIGGSYGKSHKNEEEKKGGGGGGGGHEIMVPRSGFSFSETNGGGNKDLKSMSLLSGVSGSGSEAFVMDMEESKRRKEIQALRRQEARRKREDKMRKSAGNGNIFSRKLPNAEEEKEEDKLHLLKLEQLKAKNLERETRENEISLFELPRKIAKTDEFYVEESMQQKQISSCRKGRHKQRHEAMSNEFLEISLSVVSDHPSTSGKGGSSSESEKTDDLLLHASATSEQSDKPNENDTSSSSKETDRATRICRLATRSPKASSVEKPNPPTVQGGNRGMDPLATMPSVSTTGNGPNGKTINGLLYRYSKTDVSIMCVCHGKPHTPAEFVEHAGGVDVTNPLRHITMIP